MVGLAHEARGDEGEVVRRPLVRRQVRGVDDVLRVAGVVAVGEHERLVPRRIRRHERRPRAHVERRRLHGDVVDAVCREARPEDVGDGIRVVPVVEVLVFGAGDGPGEELRGELELVVVRVVVDLERDVHPVLHGDAVGGDGVRRGGGKAVDDGRVVHRRRAGLRLVGKLERGPAHPRRVRRDGDEHAPHVVLDKLHRVVARHVRRVARQDQRRPLPRARAAPEAEEPVAAARGLAGDVEAVRDEEFLLGVGDFKPRPRIVHVIVVGRGERRLIPKLDVALAVGKLHRRDGNEVARGVEDERLPVADLLRKIPPAVVDLGVGDERPRVGGRVKAVRHRHEGGAGVGVFLAHAGERHRRRHLLTHEQRPALVAVRFVVIARRHKIRRHGGIRRDDVVEDDQRPVLANTGLGIETVAHDAQTQGSRRFQGNDDAVEVLSRSAVCDGELKDVRRQRWFGDEIVRAILLVEDDRLHRLPSVREVRIPVVAAVAFRIAAVLVGGGIA